MEAMLEQTIPQDYLPLKNRASSELKTWHVGYYFRQYQEALDTLGDPALVQAVLEEAIQRDAYGQIVENIVAQQDQKGRFIFDRLTRASVQITPIEHEYIADKRVIDPKTGLPMVMGPEHLLLSKPALQTFTNFRRNLDRRAAILWMNEFVTGEEGSVIRWASPMAAETEEKNVVASCHEYGYGYIGTIVNDERYTRLQVLDARTGSEAKAYAHYILNNSQKIVTEEGNDKLPEVDRVMTTIGVSSNLTNEQEIIKSLSESDKATGGDGLVWGLEADLAVQLIDRGLHRKLRDEAALEVARWTVNQIVLGTPQEEIQKLSRQKFIDAVKAVVDQTRHQAGGERSDYLLKDQIDWAKLENFIGFSGDFCDTGRGSSDRSVIINGEAYLRTESGELIKGIKCTKCGIVNICNKVSCFDCGARLGK